MGYLARMAAPLTDDDLYQMLLEGARRVESGQGRETASDSMDCDYGHELIEAALDQFKVRARNERWVQFGTHVGCREGCETVLEFSDELDECGLPEWERVVIPDE